MAYTTKNRNNEKYLGRFRLAEKNEKRELLLEHMTTRKLSSRHSLKKKLQRKWTLINPDGQTKNEIDYIMSNDREIIQHVSVLNSFNVRSITEC